MSDCLRKLYASMSLYYFFGFIITVNQILKLKILGINVKTLAAELLISESAPFIRTYE